MALSIFQRTVVTDSGDVVSGAEVSVINESTGLSATLYEDRDGTISLTNPFFTESDGFAQFYTDTGSYRIAATGVGVSGSITWRYVELIAQEEITDLKEQVDINTADIEALQTGGDVLSFVVSQYADGEADDVGYIIEGATVDDYTFMIWPTDGRVYEVDGATGDITSAFDPDDGSDAGLSKALINRDLGDVSSLSVATTSDINAGTSKDVVTVDQLYASQYGIGINQSYVNLTSTYVSGEDITNTDSKPRFIVVGCGGSASITLTIDGTIVSQDAGVTGSRQGSGVGIIPVGSVYSVTSSNITSWKELRE